MFSIAMMEARVAVPRMFTEGSPGGKQKSYSKRLEQGLGVLRVMLPTNRRPPQPPGLPSTWIDPNWWVCMRKRAVVSTVATVHPSKPPESFLFGFSYPDGLGGCLWEVQYSIQPRTCHENRMDESIVFLHFNWHLIIWNNTICSVVRGMVGFLWWDWSRFILFYSVLVLTVSESRDAGMDDTFGALPAYWRPV